MANISDALGTLYLEGPWTDRQKVMLTYVLMSQDDNSDYSIYTKDFETILKNLLECNSLGFSATGRWSFTYNLKALHDWSVSSQERWDKIMEQTEADYKISYDLYLEMRQELLKKMFEHDLKIAWEFADTDPGLDWMCTSAGLHIVTFNGKNYTLTYLEQDTEYYTCNLKNYCDLYNYGDDLLYERAHEILTIYHEELKLENDHTTIANDIVNIIKQHRTWYDIGVLSYFNKKEDIPKRLLKVLENYFKEKDLYDNSK